MKKRKQCGFTLIEMVITMGLLTTFLGFISLSLVSNQRRTSLSSASETVLSDFRLQQMKAMGGATDGAATPSDYGIYFGNDSYTLFRGSSYSSSDPDNFTITLDPQFQFSPVGRTVVFSRFTGVISGYISSQNSISIQDSQSGTQKTILFNQYGVPTSLN